MISFSTADICDENNDIQIAQPIFRIYGENKKLHLFHWLHHNDGRLLATAEHMLIHVDLKTRGASMPGDAVIEKMDRIYSAHKNLPKPEGLSRAVGDKV